MENSEHDLASVWEVVVGWKIGVWIVWGQNLKALLLGKNNSDNQKG